MRKKLLLLGGSRYLLPVIESAHELGAHVITCDYLPNNYAHKYSDEYHNVSIIDKEAVLELARKLEIDGIMSYATDPGVSTAAYVAEKMGLPGNNPYESVVILQNKGKFRKFLHDNGFNVPYMRTFTSWKDVKCNMLDFPYPVIVKPIDSAGSKGVTRVDSVDIAVMKNAVEYALANSIGHEVIIEKFIEKLGFSTDSDSLVINGEVVFFSLNDQWFDSGAANIYTPAAYCWPSTMPMSYQNNLQNEVQRLMKILNMGTSIYNIETRVGMDGKPYIMEVSPRAGGNRLAEMLRYACGQDIIRVSIQGALGLPMDNISQPVYNGHLGIVILHSRAEGIFKGVRLDNRLDGNVQELDIWVERGDYVRCFTGANEAIGTLVLKCQTHDELVDILKRINDLVHIEVE